MLYSGIFLIPRASFLAIRILLAAAAAKMAYPIIFYPCFYFESTSQPTENALLYLLFQPRSSAPATLKIKLIFKMLMCLITPARLPLTRLTMSAQTPFLNHLVSAALFDNHPTNYSVLWNWKRSSCSIYLYTSAPFASVSLCQSTSWIYSTTDKGLSCLKAFYLETLSTAL